jgi:hypothetical protein
MSLNLDSQVDNFSFQYSGLPEEKARPMLKAADALLEADPRYRDCIFESAATGERRPLCINDMRAMVAGIELGSHVPAEIREQFDTARNAFVYSWFVYELATLGEQQCFATLEMALRRRHQPAASPNTTRSPGLDKLLKLAVKERWLRREDFAMPSFSGEGDPACSLDIIPMLRNHLMHGNISLLPQGTPTLLRLCAEVMNRLFGQPLTI